ncbi:MAG: hypothetical protein IAE94_10495 [Chthoniobacterales bacterium]|nr:hypothetical protein [Chthoniobacterales bacterium]
MVPENITPKGIAHPDVLDAFVFDGRRGTLVLAMYETRPWTGGDTQLYQLQEKLNAYASFILDGEMTESFPQYVGRPVEIQLRSKYEPDEVALRLLASARDQLALQQIPLEVVLADVFEDSGHGCGCGSGGCQN